MVGQNHSEHTSARNDDLLSLDQMLNGVDAVLLVLLPEGETLLAQRQAPTTHYVMGVQAAGGEVDVDNGRPAADFRVAEKR